MVLNVHDKIIDQSFLKSVEFILELEGDKLTHDTGGWTKYGISEYILGKDGLSEQEIKSLVENLTRDQAIKIYYDLFWKKSSCELMCYPISLVHFNASVNHGRKRAAKVLQAAINSVGLSNPIKVDGIIGKRQTVPALELIQNSGMRHELSLHFLHHQTFFYCYLVFKKKFKIWKGKKIFYRQYHHGWMNRQEKVYNYMLANRIK